MVVQKGWNIMGCETCSHTIQALNFGGKKCIYWCSRCGTLKTETSDSISIIDRPSDAVKEYGIQPLEVRRVVSMVIWGHPLKNIDKQVILWPKGSKVLCIQDQKGIPTIWVLCNPNNEKVKVNIEMWGTGNPMETDHEYLGTVQISNYVWHVFYKEL